MDGCNGLVQCINECKGKISAADWYNVWVQQKDVSLECKGAMSSFNVYEGTMCWWVQCIGRYNV